MNNNTHIISLLSLQEKSCTKTNKRKAGGCDQIVDQTVLKPGMQE